MLPSRGGAATFGTDSSEQVRPLLAQRERLLGEISSEERQEAAEQANGRRRVAECEAEEREHREASLEEQSACKLAQSKLASSEMDSAMSLAATCSLPSQAVLQEEVRAARCQLDSTRSARTVLVQEKVASERQRLEDWISAIRTGSQENQALQANHQMAQAHLKALEAMAASSAAQVRVREAALQGLLRQVQEQDTVAIAVRGRAEAAETQLEASVAEIRRHEAISQPQGWAAVQISEHEELRHEQAELTAEVERLKKEGEKAQEHLQTTRRNLFPDDGLRTSVVQLQRAFEAAKNASQQALCQPSLLEAEVARLTTELLEEQRMVDDLEKHKHLHNSLPPSTGRGEMDARVAELNLELGLGTDNDWAMERLVAEEEALSSRLAAREDDCNRLRAEAAERDEQFGTITRDLQEQIAALTAEEQEQTMYLRVDEDRTELRTSLLGDLSASASPALLGFGMHRSLAPFGSWQSSPPETMADPGRGSEPPPRCDHRLGHQHSPHQEFQQTQVTNGLAAHQPYWRELERGWRPSTGLHETRRAASYSPGPAWRRAPQTDPGATLPIHSHDRLYPYAGSSSNDNSYLFHTHNPHNASLDSNLFRTPPTGPPQRLSPMATTQRRMSDSRLPSSTTTTAEAAALRGGFEPWQLGGGAAKGSSPPRRARTPPPRMPSMPQGMRHAEEEVAWNAAAGFRQAAPEPTPAAAQFVQQQERRAAFQARIADLKGVIGDSLQSLDEEEAGDTHQRWRADRARALAQRDEALWGRQARPAQEPIASYS